MATTILTVNVGSTSAKLAVFSAHAGLRRVAATEVSLPKGASRVDVWPAALAEGGQTPDAIVHRIVHGGDEYAAPIVLTPDDLVRLRSWERFAPKHLGPELDAVAATGARFPSVPQYACFDTSFHRSLSVAARMYPLPRRFWDAGVRRYGFHGLSCESIMASLRQIGTHAPSGRIVIAHLGGGSSLTAVRDGRSIDTTMGFSPAGGVMMSGRSGDLDPGVLLYALTEERLDANALRHLVSEDSGLAGVSGQTGDMRALLALEAADSHAAQAITLYCYLAKKALGGLIASLGGLDTLVFTGGIGEHAYSIRARIVSGLIDLGLDVDMDANVRNAAVISKTGSAVTMRVIPTAEDVVIAGHAVALHARPT